MKHNTSKNIEASFGFYHKKNVFNLVDFKFIIISFALSILFLFIFVLIIILADGFSINKILTAFLNPNNQTLSDVFGNAFGGMMIGVIALLMTVVAFVVQMAANRYTTKIVDLFIANRINLFFMTFASVTTVSVIMLLYIGDAAQIMPKISLFISFILVSLLLISIFPYFVFIFRFIQPSNIIYNIEKETFINILKGYQLKQPAARKKERLLIKLHKNYINGINQLTDITLNCIQNKDQILAIECLRSLRYILANYIKLQHIRPLPESWHVPTISVKMDVSFITFAEESGGPVGNSRYWVEDKILKQFETLFRSSINNDRTICNYIANSLYILGSKALETKNLVVLKKMILYFNTFLRATINESDVRTCFNTLNQYRKLTEKIIEAQEDNLSIEVVNHFKYYGLLAKETKGMDFILETAAHDLCDINKKAYACSLQKRSDILDIFLTVDMPIEGEKELSLRGIRKAQIQLAVYYLKEKSNDAFKLARKIYSDMLEELHRPNGFERIYTMIRELKYSREDFWEINDREYNFNYCSPEEKKHLPEFLDWFVCRLIILYTVEYSLNHKPEKAAEYLKDIQNVMVSLPIAPPIEEIEFKKELGHENLDNKANFINHILKLENYLNIDNNLTKEILAQEDLDYSKISKDLDGFKKGITTFFSNFKNL